MGMFYYVLEIQRRADGTDNQSLTARSSLALGLSYYYDRCSKMVATDLYPMVTIMLIGSDGEVYQNNSITTLYEESAE